MIEHSPFCPVSVGFSVAPQCVCKGGKADATLAKYREAVAAGERARAEAQAVMADIDRNLRALVW